MSDSTPLNDGHLEDIQRGLKQVEEALAQVRKAKAAGLDLGNVEAEIQEQGAKLRRIGQVYFPGKVR